MGMSEAVMLDMMGHMVVLGTALGTLMVLGYWKSCSDVFAPLIAHLAKLSFSEGKFPSRYKTVSVAPLLKKKELDPDVASNYRPISNLHTLSKMLERLFMARTRPHV